MGKIFVGKGLIGGVVQWMWTPGVMRFMILMLRV
jgi:hypothetical protein